MIKKKRLLARRVLFIVLFNRTNLWITKEILKGKASSQGNGDAVHGRHGESLERRHASVGRERSLGHSFDGARSKEVGVAVNQAFTGHICVFLKEKEETQ